MQQLWVEGPRTHAVNQELGRRTDMEMVKKTVLEMVKRTTPVADKGDSSSVLLVPDAAPEVCSGFD